MAEQGFCKAQVVGSTPITSSRGRDARRLTRVYQIAKEEFVEAVANVNTKYLPRRPYDDVAQLVERRLAMAKVAGSSPVIVSNVKKSRD